MKEIERQLRKIGISNPHNLASTFGIPEVDDFFIDNTQYGNQTRNHNGTYLYCISTGVALKDRSYGKIHERRRNLQEKSGIKDWVKFPFGEFAYVPKSVMDRAKSAIKSAAG